MPLYKPSSSLLAISANAQEAATTVGPAGSFKWNYEDNQLHIYDGVTLGGFIRSFEVEGAGGGASGPVETKFYTEFDSNTSNKFAYEFEYATWLDSFVAASNVTELRSYFSQGLGEITPTHTLTDTTQIAAFQNALSTGVGYTTSSGWSVAFSCGSPNSGSISTWSNSPYFYFEQGAGCNCNTTPVLRPLIGNSNWGGYGGGCSQATQFMGMGFIV